MNRDAFFWTLALFFGSSIAFGAIQDATKNESLLLTIGLQAVLLAVVIGAIVLVMKRKRR